MMTRAADPMEKSSSSAIMLFEDDDDEDDNNNNNAFYNDDLVDFSIDIGDFYAILDEESPPPPSSQSANVEGFQHGEVTPSQFDPKQKSHEESTTDAENSQRNLVALDPQQEPRFGFHYESEANLNDITGGGGAHGSTHFDSNYVPMAAQYSSNGLVLTCPDNNCSPNAFGGSSGSFLPANFDQLQFQTNMQECGVQGGSINSACLSPLPAADGLYFNSEKVDSGNHDHKPSFRIEFEESNSNRNRYCSSSKGQNGETGSSLAFPLENCNFTRGMHSSVKLSSFQDSVVEDGNMYPLLRYLYKDSNARVPHRVKHETNTFEASKVTCDGTNRCLTLPTDSYSSAKFGFPQIVPAQFQQDVQYNSENLDGRDYRLFPSQNSCWISDVKLQAKEESTDSSLADASISDLEAPLSEEPCIEYSHSDDASLMSESSADSSPITSSRNSTSDHVDRIAVNASQCLVSGSDITLPTGAKSSFKDKREDQLLQPGNTHSDFLKGCSVPVQKNPSRSSMSVQDDPDICILDDISDPICPNRLAFHPKLHLMSQRPEFSDPRYHGIGGMRLRPDDERLTFRLALKDLSQPKSEVSPPDGVLAVPLLRHQRIALSWMVKKETVSLHCSGGILADDQGLGKTVSTIALILMERSPSTRPVAVKKEDEYEALNLDDDDDAEVSVMKQPHRSIHVMMDKPMKKENSSTVVRGRPAAGTLVVCPTSVLRQWAEELQTKVTSKANLSYLVYHGSNRTKDPNELAKYDVVLTTYAIVSMEVPKQPLADKDDEEKGKHDTSSFSGGLLNSKKRKDPPTSNIKNRKGTSAMDGALLESAARPLGRVGWFRVILDEAQSIKNYRTQVARACWGLRAKRRWCLSGTPIQNAVDDLYSYFRFLRYDPYAVYKSFCSTIKTPISRNPTKGYKMLQAVLKTVMLRRTKGTLIDGKPIINLPPKIISLKKVEFSMEEREFYSTLEAVSREQFMQYEDAGTVKQNYVNILLMLLRLRQACDHPLLVKGCDSNSNLRSSTETAKKLSREKRIILLSCLEISLAICTICNDPPEDAVVTICGHVFCNQCVCEHLTADENICPSPNCKVPLRASSVFSKSTLKSSLSDELADDCCSGSSCFEMGHGQKKFEDNWSSGSSKIKAAIEILCSLPGFQCSLERDIEKCDSESSNGSENTPNSVSMKSPMDSSGKGQTCLKSTPKREISEKAIVFSQWTGMLDLLEVPLKASSIKYRRLDGTMSVAGREKAIKDFNTLPEVTVIIMSLKAASLGLNLVAANHVILLDLWWNPTTEDQAIDRAHRIGQTRPVTVSRLTVKDTVEDKILSLQEKKRVMVASAFGEDESVSRQSRLTVEDMRYLFMA